MKNIIFAALASLAMIAPAHAVSINGTGAVADVGITSNTPPGQDINVGDLFTIAASLFSSGTGDLAVIAQLTPIVVAPFTAAAGQAWSFTSAFGTFVGSISSATKKIQGQNHVVYYFALGTFTPAGVLGGYTPGAMSVTGSLTQTGPAGAAISSSWSMASPPASVPEPASLALLGLGLAGLGFVRRAKA